MKKRKTKIVSFKKVDGKWYCDIKGWPKALFAQTLMVGNASKLIEELSIPNIISPIQPTREKQKTCINQNSRTHKPKFNILRS